MGSRKARKVMKAALRAEYRRQRAGVMAPVESNAAKIEEMEAAVAAPAPEVVEEVAPEAAPEVVEEAAPEAAEEVVEEKPKPKPRKRAPRRKAAKKE